LREPQNFRKRKLAFVENLRRMPTHESFGRQN
jgi:hypothetical protein